MNRAQPKRNPEWSAGFFFLGNQLTLDFLNTRPAPDGEPIELLPDFSGLLEWFQAAGVLSSRAAAALQQQWGESARARRALQAIREFRERLRKVVLGWERGEALHPSMLDELNRLLAAYPMRSRLKASGDSLAEELWFEPREPEDLLAPLAHSAMVLFVNVDRSRVRKCGHCVAHFHDISKKGTRRWCSMQFCGNRLKVAAYAARQRRHSRDNEAPGVRASV